MNIKRILIIANTYYQMILAVQMNATIFEKDEVVLLMSDQSKKSDYVAHNLALLETFQEVHHIKTKGLINNRKNYMRIRDFVDITFRNNNYFRTYINQIDNVYFDEIICFNYNIDIIGLFSILYNINNNIKVSLYEEGLLSYGVSFESNYRREIIKHIRHMIGKDDISDSFSNFYCYYPQLYNGKLNKIKVPIITKDCECTRIIRDIFDLDNNTISYQQKYILFTSVHDIEGGEPIGEYDLAKKVSKLVGKNNLIVKTHPRDTREIYENNGFNVDKNSWIPWEAIQLAGDFSNNVFLSAASSSALAGSFISEYKTETIFLYNFCNTHNNKAAQESIKGIQGLLRNSEMRDVFSKVRVAEEIEEILV